MTLTPADIELVESAAAELDSFALDLRMCHTKGGRNDDWTGEEEARASYHELKTKTAALYALAERMKAAQ